MTDRYHSLTVVLEEDVRSDDAEAIIEAIKMIRGVLDVTPHIADTASWMAQTRVRRELGEKLMSILYPKETA